MSYDDEILNSCEMTNYLPKIKLTIFDGRIVSVCGYKKLVLFSSESIVLSTNEQQKIEIKGSLLSIKKMARSEIIIQGIIISCEFI